MNITFRDNILKLHILFLVVAKKHFLNPVTWISREADKLVAGETELTAEDNWQSEALRYRLDEIGNPVDSTTSISGPNSCPTRPVPRFWIEKSSSSVSQKPGKKRCARRRATKNRTIAIACLR